MSLDSTLIILILSIAVLVLIKVRSYNNSIKQSTKSTNPTYGLTSKELERIDRINDHLD